MRKIIILLISQILFIQVSQSQTDHVMEGWNDTWQKYNDAKNENERWAKEVKANAARISSLERNAEKDLSQINTLNKIQDGLIKRLRKAQVDYSRVFSELKKKNDSIKVLINRNKDLTTKNKDLKGLVDSFSVALEEEKLFNEMLLNEKKQLEQQLYFKGMDLQIAEIDNSYFSSFDLGYKRLLVDEVYYLENSKAQSAKPILTSLEYIRYTGSVYTPAHIDTLKGFILIYKDDKLYDQVPRRFFAETKTSSYCHYEIDEKKIKLNYKIKPRSNIKIAYVTDESFHTNREKLQDFNESHRSGYFVISSTRPQVNYNMEETGSKEISENEVFAATDTFNLDFNEIVIKLCTNGSSTSGEYVTLSTKALVVEKIRLLLYQDASVAYNLRLEEGANVIKIKALSDSNINTGCNLWIYLETKDGIIRRKKLTILKKGDLYRVIINYSSKSFN